ncbi:MAG: FhaA domain-containing protein [Nocardioides sp.]|uniref:FhaA domain-containing protein n=1 Tax=Nocardioides sp. TaxID=35761 RepID=UPI003D6BC9FF
MSGLQKFEQRLEQLISGAFAKAFRSEVKSVEIVAALQREIDNNAQVLSRQRRLVPNDFHVELSASDLGKLESYGPHLKEELKRQLMDHAEAQGFVFPGRVNIEFGEANDLTIGRFRVRSRAQAAVSGGDMSDTQVSRAQAFLEINGTRHPLHGNVVVGRGTDADLRINDPGISRRHIEFRSKQAGDRVRVEVYDLGSTNGMLVNGQKMASATLDDGSQVRIGTTVITSHIVEERR